MSGGAATLLSPYVGIVRSSVDMMRAADESRLPTVGCTLADARAAVGVETVGHTGGAGLTRFGALAAGIGEAAERYAAAYVPPGLPLAAAHELGEEAVAPSSFSLFHARQHARAGFPFHRFDECVRIRWTAARNLFDGRRQLVPAQLVYLRRLWADEPPIAYATSNGLACAPTATLALRGALCELIERDAFMIAWYGRLALPLLDWRRHATLAELDRKYFARTGLEYAAVDLGRFFGVPAVLGIVFGPEGEYGGLGVGAACAPTIEQAWLKALGEAFSVRRWARDLGVERRNELPIESDRVASFDDHVLYYTPPDRVPLARFLTESAKRTDTRDLDPLPGSTPVEQVSAVCERLAAKGVNSYAVDVTTIDIADAGLRVVRAIAPELAPLDVLESARYLGGRRLYDAAFEVGCAPRRLDFDEINPHPHPFP